MKKNIDSNLFKNKYSLTHQKVDSKLFIKIKYLNFRFFYKFKK